MEKRQAGFSHLWFAGVSRRPGALTALALIASFIALVTFVSPVPAQPEPLTTLSGQLELARVVDLAAERLDLNIEYDAAKLKGTVTLRLGGGVTDAELWALTNRLLASRGFTTVRRAGEATVSVVALAEAAEAARVEPERDAGGDAETDDAEIGDEAPRGPPDPEVPAGFRTEVVRIEHGNTSAILEALQPLMGRTGKVTRIGDGDRLLISATAEQHGLVGRFLQDLDAPDAETTVEKITIRHLNVDRLMAIVEQMQASRELVSGRRLPGRLVRAPGGDSVLVIAPESKLHGWRALIQQLDRREPVSTRSYTPSHFGLEEVRSLIESTIAPQATADERWRVVSDTLTGSLIVTATESQHDAIEALLPLKDPVPDLHPPSAPDSAASDREPLDLAVFSVPIWYVPPPPPAPPPEPEPRRLAPFTLELIAIVDAEGRTEAVFYDPQRDALVQVAVGQALGEGRVIDAIDADGVEIREGTGTRTVALERGRP